MKIFCSMMVVATLVLPTQSFADTKLPTLLGDIESLTPSVYQMRQRPEPTALREVLELREYRDALLQLAKDDFEGVVWREPGVEHEARVVALREATYIALGEWGGPGVQAFLFSELENASLADSTERTLLEALGRLSLDAAGQQQLLSRLDAPGRNPKVRFETLNVLMKQGRSIALEAYQKELVLKQLVPLELTRLGAQLVITDTAEANVLPRELWTQVVKSTANVSESRFAAEALWRTMASLPGPERKVALEILRVVGPSEVKQSIERRQRWSEKRRVKASRLP